MHGVATKVRVMIPVYQRQDCHFCNILSSDQESRLATPTYKARKEKKGASPSPSLVDPDSVQILGQVKNSKTSENAATKEKVDPTKEPAKKKLPSKLSSSTTEEIKALDASGCRASGKDFPAT